MIYQILIFVTVFIINNTLFADKITIINHTQIPVWAGIYTVPANLLGTSIGEAELQSKIMQISPDEQVEMVRPGLKLKINREILFSNKENDLKKNINKVKYNLLNKIAAGTTQGSTFHIAEKDGNIEGYNNIKWKVVEPIITAARKSLERSTDFLRKKLSKHAYGKTKAIVRSGSNLAQEEIKFLNKREPKVKKALEDALKINLDGKKIPRIALCLSGGGMRAATATLGLLEGLEHTGLLNAITYAAALSGSTWTTASFVELGLNIHDYAEHFKQTLTQTHTFSIADLVNVLQSKIVFNQQVGIIDIYGVCLATMMFHNMKNHSESQDIKLSNSQRHIKEGDIFFPIYTAVQVEGDDFHWAEFNPYEFSIDYFNAHIPIWSFGRKFKNGTSTDFPPEISLGFLMGIWGSAISGSVKNIINASKKDIPQNIFKALNNVTVEIGVSGLRPAAIRIYNLLYGVKNSAVRNLQQLTLMDAGYDNIFPYPAVFKKERNIDIIIFLDASGSVFSGTPDFKKVAEYAKENNIPFPPIKFKSLTKTQVNVFTDDKNPSSPIVIYLAPVKNKNFDASFDPEKVYSSTYPTFKFYYEESDINNLKGVIRQNIIDNKNKFFDAINQKIKQNGITE